MKTILALFIILLCRPQQAPCEQGKLVLHDGTVLAGEIKRLPAGAVRIYLKNASVDFDRSEIARIMYGDTVPAVRRERARLPVRHSARFDPYIHSAASRYGMDPDLVRAVICAESAFNPRDRSSAGACGLMQLMPDTARRLGVKDIFSPRENIHGGTRFLGYMLDQFRGDLGLALAAYNAGPATVRRFGTIPPFRETREYVRLVMNYYTSMKNSGELVSYTDESGRIHIRNAK